MIHTWHDPTFGNGSGGAQAKLTQQGIRNKYANATVTTFANTNYHADGSISLVDRYAVGASPCPTCASSPMPAAR